MSRRNRESPHQDRSARPATGELGRLLETEQRLEQRLQAARREAAALVDQARQAARAREARLAEELEAAERDLRRRVTDETNRHIRALGQKAEAEVRRFAGAPDSVIDRLARMVVERVVQP